MRIFMVLSRIPYPLEKGDKLRAFYQIKELSKNNEIILFALDDRNVNKEEAFQFLQAYCRSVNFFDRSLFCRLINLLKAFFNGKPFQVGYFYSHRIRKKMLQLVAEYKPDHIYFQLARMAEYNKSIDIPKTIDYQDAFSKGLQRRMKYAHFFKRLILWMEYRRMLKYEHRIFSSFDHKTIISAPDREAISHPKKKNIQIIQNGVDFDYYQPQTCEKEFDLIFSGNMSYPPNILGARYLIKKILPILHKNNLQVKTVLAGANPTESIKSMASKNITITAWVDDLRQYYAKSKVFVAPMQIGTGLQNKLLEAMSMGIPCITTPLTNQALGASHAENILIAQTATEFATQIEYLLKNPKEAERIGKKGRTFVQENYSWEKAGKKLEKIMQSN